VRFDDALTSLSRLEMEDTVSVRDVVAVLQPGEMVRRIAEEIEGTWSSWAPTAA
jgi:DNA integrity scanning protein DisA with diadenylate cyclase activity